MTSIRPQFGTLHPSTERALKAQIAKGNKPLSLPEIAITKGSHFQKWTDLLGDLTDISISGNHKLLDPRLNTISHEIRPEAAGTLLLLASNKDLFPTNISRKVQQILYNHFIGEENLEKDTLGLDAFNRNTH